MLSELGATETITIGQGGQGSATDGNGNAGSNSTFGSHVTSYGGKGGDDDDGQYAQGSTPFGRGNVDSFAVRDNFAYSIFSGGYGAQQKLTGQVLLVGAMLCLVVLVVEGVMLPETQAVLVAPVFWLEMEAQGEAVQPMP